MTKATNQDEKKQQPKGGIKPKNDELTGKELEKAAGGRKAGGGGGLGGQY